MSTISVDTYDRRGDRVAVEFEIRDGYVMVPPIPVLYMSATELDELAQAAASAATMIRDQSR